MSRKGDEPAAKAIMSRVKAITKAARIDSPGT